MKVLPFSSPDDVAAALPLVTTHLDQDGLIAYPTETVYGIGCALRPVALTRLAALKRSGGWRPFLLLTADAEGMGGLIWSACARTLAARFWPGPLTVTIATRPGAFPPQVLAQGGVLALRATPHAGVRALVLALRGPVTSTSANVPGDPPATDAASARDALAQLGAPADTIVLDGGNLPQSASSTIVDCTGARPRLLRAGAIPIEQLREALGAIDG